MAGKREVGLDGRSARPGRPRLRSARPVSPPSFEAVTPAAHTTVRVGMRRVLPAPSSMVTDSASIPTTVEPSSGVTPSRSSDRCAFADSEGGKLVSTRSATSISRMRPFRGSTASKSRRKRVARQLGDLAGHLHAGRSGPDDRERQPGGTAVRVGLRFGRLERAENPAPDGQRALERLDLGRELAPFVVTEVRVCRAAGHDQRVVRHRLGRRHLADRAQMNLARVEVEVGDLGEQHAGRCGRA